MKFGGVIFITMMLIYLCLRDFVRFSVCSGGSLLGSLFFFFFEHLFEVWGLSPGGLFCLGEMNQIRVFSLLLPWLCSLLYHKRKPRKDPPDTHTEITIFQLIFFFTAFVNLRKEVIILEWITLPVTYELKLNSADKMCCFGVKSQNDI